MVAVGLAIGYFLSLQAGRVIRSLLIGVRPDDSVTFVGVALTLLLVAVVASVLPSLRIMRIDPAITLREE
jgi:ABC-type lipoprotein release transport system permease subunit